MKGWFGTAFVVLGTGACGLALGEADLNSVRCEAEGHIGAPACGDRQVCAAGRCRACAVHDVCKNKIDDDCDGVVDNNCVAQGGAGGTPDTDASGSSGNSPDASVGGAAGSGGIGAAGGEAGSSGTGGGPQSICGDKIIAPPEVCDDGYQDACGTCNADCTGPGTGSNCGDGQVCQETETCDNGPGNGCGACNTACNGPGGVCSATCAGGAPAQTFGSGMVGCSGTQSFANRAVLCGSGSNVCTAAQWVANHGGVAPKYNYWVNDGPMYYWGSDQYGTSCAAYGSSLGYGACNSTNSPMRVCVPNHTDPLNNQCNWANCGWKTSSPNEYFGGCNGDTTAGALCCLP